MRRIQLRSFFLGGLIVALAFGHINVRADSPSANNQIAGVAPAAPMALGVSSAVQDITPSTKAPVQYEVPPPPLGGSAAGRPAYRIQAGDQIQLYVLGHDELKAVATVLPDGMASFPATGVLHVANLTNAELTALLTKELSATVNSPTVTATIIPLIDAQRASVIGEVKLPGQYPVNSDTRLIDVIAAAGGLSQTADLTSILVIKKGASQGTPIDGGALMNTGDTKQNLAISPGDVVIVRAVDERWLVVQIGGDVLHPGAYAVPKQGILLASAIAMAGGLLPTASLKNAQILHDGVVRMVDINMVLEDLGDKSSQARLLPGDIFQVPTSRARVAVLGEVHNPGAYPMPDRDPLTLSQAILLAGGTKETADARAIKLQHTDSEGKTVSSQLDLTKILDGHQQDPQLATGDTVYVTTYRKADGVNWGSMLNGLGGVAAIINLAK